MELRLQRLPFRCRSVNVSSLSIRHQCNAKGFHNEKIKIVEVSMYLRFQSATNVMQRGSTMKRLKSQRCFVVMCIGFFGTNKDEDGNDPESIPVMELSHPEQIQPEGEVPLGAREGKSARDYCTEKWTAEECLVLQVARQVEFGRQGKDENSTADIWQQVEDFCFAENVHRSGQQCKSRWKRMSAGFKKIYNYQNHATDDGRNYWNLTAEEKKSKKLPRVFWKDVFVEMSKWLPKQMYGGNENIVHDSEAQQQEDSGEGGSSEGLSDSDQGNSDPFVDFRPSKKRKASIRTNESLAEIIQTTHNVFLECEERKDQRLERALEVSERNAGSYRGGLAVIADAILSLAPRDPEW